MKKKKQSCVASSSDIEICSVIHLVSMHTLTIVHVNTFFFRAMLLNAWSVDCFQFIHCFWLMMT